MLALDLSPVYVLFIDYKTSDFDTSDFNTFDFNSSDLIHPTLIHQLLKQMLLNFLDNFLSPSTTKLMTPIAEK